ncbi:high-potential iron-sulfur protein [Halorhodospira neutriphila]|uniref:High-potential iron-sulfur protein n=1 Tax=Halorhodospira neutriphila TaxID=168379 RepID=A0ABS1E6Q5_9GAMM|nr:high-potential iron-sulfur protein [Halorhodospira neutriphila]MBK1727190.1 hypothetical protein [Halorhodospira neutriphila]
MSNTPSDHSRRKFLRLGLLSTAAIPAAGMLLRSGPAAAQEGGAGANAQRVDPQSPEARGLGYVHNQADADKSHPRFDSSQFCANCLLFRQHEDKGSWGYCAAFGDKLVNANGWCWAWEDAADAQKIGPQDV